MKKIPFEDKTNFTTNDVIVKNSIINTIDDVKNFINDCLTVLNLNFHPDDSFELYTKYSDQSAMFTPEECVALNNINDKCFEVCEKYNEDYYDLCFTIFNELNGNIFGNDSNNEPETTAVPTEENTNEYYVLNNDYNNFKQGTTFIKKGKNFINENGQLIILPVNEVLNIFSTSQNNSTYKPNRMISAQRGDNGNFNWVNYQKNFKGNSVGVITKTDITPTTIDTNTDTNVDTDTTIDLEIGEGYKFLNTDNNILRVKYIGVSESNKNELLFKHSILKDVIKVNKENIKNLIIK